MNDIHSDALVFFGATGDLAYKKIFPSLLALQKRGHLDVPVIGVAKSGWTLDQLRARARDSVQQHGGFDATEFDGSRAGCVMSTATTTMPPPSRRSAASWAAPSTPRTISPFRRCCSVRSSNSWRGRLHRRRARHRRKAVRPRPRVGAGAQPHSAHHVRRGAHLPHRPLSGQAAGAQHGVLPLRQRVSRTDLESQVTSRACRSRWPRTSAFRAAARSTTRPAPSAT